MPKNYLGKENFKLFNIVEDIGETSNLASTHHEKAKELSENLTAYLKKVNAQMPSQQSTKMQVAWSNEK